MEYQTRSRSNAISMSECQRSLFMNDDSYDKDLYQFERVLQNNSNSLQLNQSNPFFKKQSQCNIITEENAISSYCYLNDGFEVDQQIPHSKQSLETSHQLSIDNIRSIDDLKSITDCFIKNLNIQENKGMSETNIPTSKLIHH